jgi:hypothetical protein
MAVLSFVARLRFKSQNGRRPSTTSPAGLHATRRLGVLDKVPLPDS